MDFNSVQNDHLGVVTMELDGGVPAAFFGALSPSEKKKAITSKAF